MVKINGYDPNLKQISQKNTGRTSPVTPADKAEFTKALHKADSAAMGIGDVVKLSQADLQAVYGAGRPEAMGVIQDAEINAAAESALDLLDAYQRALGRPGTSLKSMASMVQGLEAQARRLDELSVSLPEGDDRRALLNSIGVQAMVEAVKFNRGDYI